MQPLSRRELPALLAAGLLAGCTTLRATPPVTPLPQDVAWSWNDVLGRRGDEQGRIDFRGIAADRGPLEIVVAGIGRTAPFNAPADFPTRDDALAFHINAYNALAMYDVVRSFIPERLSQIDRVGFFKLTRFVVGGREISLDDYENQVIRPFGEERVHFALNDMTRSSPRLPRGPFTAEDLDGELDAATRVFLAEPRNLQLDPARRVVRLSPLFRLYAEDFLRRAPSLIAWINRYRIAPIPGDYRVEFIEYDWTINAQPRDAADPRSDY